MEKKCSSFNPLVVGRQESAMSKPKVFVARYISEAQLEPLRRLCEIDLWGEDTPPPRQELLKHVRGVCGLLSLLTDQIDREVMEIAGHGLKVISNCAVGYDNIDVREASQRGIPVGNTPGVLTETTADFAFSLLLAAARRIVEGDAFTRAGRWKTWSLSQLLGQDISGATLGIIGFGRIGRRIAQYGAGFEMRILVCDPSFQSDPSNHSPEVHSVSLDTLLREADFVSIHTPLTEATHHLIDSAALAKMKPTAILINTARGPVVDPDALYLALKNGVIRYAALDVTEPEPLPADHPLLTIDNLIVTPHIASASVETRGKMVGMAVSNLAAGLKDERLPNCVNPEVYEVTDSRTG
jgi:glyoxylate reductase